MSNRQAPIVFSLVLSLLLILVSLTISFPPTATAAPTASITVTTNNDSGTGSLRQAIADANPDDTINFASGLSGQTITLITELVIAKNLTISSSVPITISGNDLVRVFNISSGDVTFNNLTIANGNVQTDDCGAAGSFLCGGGIMIQNAGVSVTVTNAIFRDNAGGAAGGAIMNYEGLLVIENSSFTLNWAEGGGGIFNYQGSVTINATLFSGNVGTTNDGGGAFNQAGSMMINNSTLSGNSAQNGGGLHTYQGTVMVNNSTLTGNTVSQEGGGIYNDGGSLHLQNSILANSAGGLDCYNAGSLATDTNNLVESHYQCGTPLSSDDPALETLQDNGGSTHTHALTSSSPAINAGDSGSCLSVDQRGIARPYGVTCDIGAYEFEGTPCTSSAITVVNNQSNGAGSLRQAIQDLCAGGTIDFAAALDGSIIYISASGELLINKSMTISSSVPITISGNNLTRVFNISSGDVMFNNLTIANGNVQTDDCGAGGSFLCGGGIMIQNAGVSVTVTNAIFRDNAGGAAGGAIMNYEGSLVIENSSFTTNWAEGGGGIYNYQGSVTISATLFSGNVGTTNDGGGVHNQAGSMMINNSTLSGNSAQNGGGLHTYQGTAMVNNSTLTGNTVSQEGGGIYNESGTLHLQNSILANSVGGLDCYNTGSIATNNNNLIESHQLCGTPVSMADPALDALQDNGGSTHTHALTSSSPAINTGDNGSCLLVDQRGVTRPYGATCDIGAYEFEGTPCTSSAITTINNQSSGAGSLRQAIQDLCAGGTIDFAAALDGSVIDISADGELLINKSMTINSSVPITISGGDSTRIFNIIDGNVSINNLTVADGNVQTDDCGGIGSQRCGSGIMIQNSGVEVTINNSAFVNNHADYFGAGIAVSEGTLIVTNSVFSYNTADTQGGGIHNWFGTATINNSSFFANLTGSGGGGVYNLYGTTTINNSLFSSNAVSSIAGPAVFNDNGDLTVKNSTFSDNSSIALDGVEGGGIYNLSTISGSFYLYNSILANTSGGTDCYSNSGVTAGVNNLIEGNGGCGTAVSSADPNLGPLQDNGGYTPTQALLLGSPAIDAGNDATCLPTDQRGVARHDGDGDGTIRCDIGSYESGTMIPNISSGNMYVFNDQSGVAIEVISEADLAYLYIDERMANHPQSTGTMDGTHLRTGKHWLIEGLQSDGVTEATTFNVRLTLPYASADASTRVCKWLDGTGSGHGWDCVGTSTTYDAGVSVTRHDVIALSEWAVGDNVGPTAVTLAKFEGDMAAGWLPLLLGIIIAALVTISVARIIKRLAP